MKRKEIERTKMINMDFFKNVMSPEDLLFEIDEVCKSIESKEVSDKSKISIMNEFLERSKKWEIVMGDIQERKVWIQMPAILHEVEYKVNFKEKMKFLLQKGIILNSKQKEKSIDLISNVEEDTEIIADKKNFMMSNIQEINDFYCKLTYILLRIIEVIKQFNSSIAIYEKPYGTIASNNLIGWIDEIEKEKKIKLGNLKHTIEPSTFFNIINNYKVHYEEM